MQIDKKYKITKCCSKDEYRPAMQGVYISEDGYAVATDSYKLAKVSVEFNDDEDIFKDKILNPVMVDKSQKEKTLPTINSGEEGKGIWVGENTYLSPFIDEKFPPYQPILDNTFNATKVYSVYISAKHLYELSQALGSDNVLMYFQAEGFRPIRIIADDAEGILMPVKHVMSGINMAGYEEYKQELIDKSY